MLAVIGAMKEEVDLLAAQTTVSERRVHAGIEVIRGRFRGTAAQRAPDWRQKSPRSLLR